MTASLTDPHNWRITSDREGFFVVDEEDYEVSPSTIRFTSWSDAQAWMKQQVLDNLTAEAEASS